MASTETVQFHRQNIKEVKPLSDKTSKTKEDMLIELYIKKYITKTQYFEMLKRLKKEENK